MTNPALRVGLAALALAAGILTAQIPATPARPAAAGGTVLRPPPGMVPIPGGAIACGPHYEAEIVAGAIEFRPVFGTRAERLLPLGLRLESIRRGDHVVLRAGADDQPALELTADTATFVRSDSIQERYQARMDGIEQSFVFARAIAGDGDLVVRLAVRTGLQAQPGPDGTIGFVHQQVGAVRVGTVVGIDAVGRQVAGSLQLVDDAVELRLPAAFLDDATWPVVLDPLIGTQFSPGVTTWNDITPDVAYDFSSDTYLIVWTRVFASNSQLVRAQLVAGDGTPIGSYIVLEQFVDQRQTRPRVCNVNGRDRFLVVWEEDRLAGITIVRGLGVTPAGSFSIATTLAAPTWLGQPRNATLPAVAGDPATSTDAAMLTYHSDLGLIVAVPVTVAITGPPTVGTGTTLFSGVTNPRGLAISKTGGTAGRYVVVYSRFGTLHAIAVDRAAQPLGVSVQISQPGSGLNIEPVVDGSGSEFLMLWQKERSPGSNTWDIVGRALTASATGLTASGGERILSPGPGNRMLPDVCFLGGKYAAFWTKERPGTSRLDDVEGGIVLADCTLCGPLHILSGLQPAHAIDNHARCIGKRAGATGGGEEGLLVFADLDEISGDSDLVGQRIASRSQGLPPTVVGPGCGTGGTPGTAGSGFVFGNQSFALTVSGADPNDLLACVVGIGALTAGCGSCQVLIPGGFGFVPNVAGSGTYPFPLPCDGRFLDTLIEFQWIGLRAGVPPCNPVTGFWASTILQLQLVP